jgi:hypothetical protein
MADLLGQAGLQVALRQAFQEFAQASYCAAGTMERMRLSSVGSMAAW